MENSYSESYKSQDKNLNRIKKFRIRNTSRIFCPVVDFNCIVVCNVDINLHLEERKINQNLERFIKCAHACMLFKYTDGYYSDKNKKKLFYECKYKLTTIILLKCSVLLIISVSDIQSVCCSERGIFETTSKRLIFEKDREKYIYLSCNKKYQKKRK